ncbi:MAG TPA: hypothetical protein VLJ86_05540, partial [Ramlibacter sp.]|nr:hypothetical protein [Ramlibacter sp.]
MDRFGQKVARYEHIASRVAKVVDFHLLSLADVKAAVTAKASLGDSHDAPALPMEDAVIAAIADQCKGRMRLLLNAVANIEQWAQANSWKKITGEHIKGKQLCVEFNGKTLGRVRGELV